MKNLHEIYIIPGKFIKKENNKYIIKCLIEKDITENRIFDEYSLRGIENPNLVFIGIMTGVGMMQISFVNANEFKYLFRKKWKVLLK
jgi:2-phosphoglycerate kinase